MRAPCEPSPGAIPGEVLRSLEVRPRGIDGRASSRPGIDQWGTSLWDNERNIWLSRNQGFPDSHGDSLAGPLKCTRVPRRKLLILKQPLASAVVRQGQFRFQSSLRRKSNHDANPLFRSPRFESREQICSIEQTVLAASDSDRCGAPGSSSTHGDISGLEPSVPGHK